MTTNRPETNAASAYSEGAPMTDKTIPAGLTRDEARAVREWAERARDAEVQDEIVAHAARVLLAVLPKPPTLVDMTLEERRACQWMQADTEQLGRAVILQPNASAGRALMLDPEANLVYAERDRVTPRPDLPPLEWPHTYQEAKDTPPAKVGDVIESADDPRLDDLPIGTTLLDRDGETATKHREEWEGIGYIPIPSEGTEYGPWTIRIIPEPNPEP